MSLLEEAYEPFVIMNKSVVDDGYGGTATVWTDGATIQGAMVLDTSTEMRIAQAQGVTAAYTLTVRKDIELDYHTVLKREKDNKIFRLLSDTDDKKTPKSAGLNMRQYTAEEFVLPK
jgi:hypothetical protein